MDILHYLGVDFHPYQQTVAFVDKSGEIKTRRFFHSDKTSLRKFYQQFPKGTWVAVEATGSLHWFEKMLFELNLELKIGNPRSIRKMALSPHKNDARDARHILDLLQTHRFPAIKQRTEESQTLLAQLNYRHSLVSHRTALANQLQAMARSFGLPRFQMKTKLAKQRLRSVAQNPDFLWLINSRLTVFESLTQQIKAVEAKLAVSASLDEQVKLLKTHSGVGDLTALAVVHTLGDVGRFAKASQVVSFVGLAPLDESSGEKHRIGKISKHGSRLLRFLLGQAGQRTKDEKLRNFYKEVSRRRGKAKAKVAVARKLLVTCYLMLREQITYEEFRRRGEVDLPGYPREKTCS